MRRDEWQFAGGFARWTWRRDPKALLNSKLQAHREDAGTSEKEWRIRCRYTIQRACIADVLAALSALPSKQVRSRSSSHLRYYWSRCWWRHLVSQRSPYLYNRIDRYARADIFNSWSKAGARTPFEGYGQVPTRFDSLLTPLTDAPRMATRDIRMRPVSFLLSRFVQSRSHAVLKARPACNRLTDHRGISPPYIVSLICHERRRTLLTPYLHLSFAIAISTGT